MKNILSFNPGHDGAFAYLKDGHLLFSIEAEKNSNYRHSPISVPDVFNVLGELEEIPDVICRGGWWPSDAHLSEQRSHAGYRGVVRVTLSLTNDAFWERQFTISRLPTNDRIFFVLLVCRVCPKAPHAMRWYGKE